MNLPLPPPEIARQYRQLIADLESAMAEAARGLGLECGPGCASCCIAFSVLPLEAALLRAVMENPRQQAPPPRAPEREDDPCPLLAGDLCRVYAARPIICRTQGLALAYVDEEREAIEVSACPRNFADDFPFRPGSLLFMDPFNSRLWALNQEYCRQQGIPADRRIPIASLA